VAKEGFLGENEEPSEDEVDMMDIVDEADEGMDEAGCLVEEVNQVKDGAMPGLTATKQIDRFLLPGRRNFPAIDPHTLAQGKAIHRTLSNHYV